MRYPAVSVNAGPDRAIRDGYRILDDITEQKMVAL